MQRLRKGSSKTSSQVITRSRAGIAATRQLSSDTCTTRHIWHSVTVFHRPDGWLYICQVNGDLTAHAADALPELVVYSGLGPRPEHPLPPPPEGAPRAHCGRQPRRY